MSVGRPQRVTTPLGVVVVHQVAPEVFGGYETSVDGIALATPAKTIFDIAYLAATHGRRFRHLPEVSLDRRYRGRDARAWAARIPSPRLRTITLDLIDTIERDSARVAAP